MNSPTQPPRGRLGLSLIGHDPYQQLRRWQQWAETQFGIQNPFHRPIDAVEGPRVVVAGRKLLSFSSYNYLGLSGDPRVNAAAKEAIDRWGTSVSASRVVAGERPLHRQLERAVAELLGVDDALAFVSGHATNVTTLGCLFGSRDLILYDILSHNSLQQGIRLSGARSLPFPHNNVAAAEAMLSRERSQCDRVLLVTEGVFSMDGDVAPLPEFVALRSRYNALLMVDEAHSMGVLGAGGRGIAEHFGLPGDAVDLWMGTFSKAFAGCGGYIAGCQGTIDALRQGAPGHVYSCGMTPPNAAAALQSIRLMRAEPDRVQRLAARSERLRRELSRSGFDIGAAAASAVVPVILGSSAAAVAVAHLLFERGFLVHPLFFPVVPERSARLRFFVTADHTDDDLDATIAALAAVRDQGEELKRTLPADIWAALRSAEAGMRTTD